MSELEPIAWMFDWVSSEVDKPYTSISLSYPVDEHEVFVSNIRPLYEITVPVLELQRKAKLVDDLVKVLEEVDEALYCASEWIVPIMLPTRVKEAIAKAKEQSCSTLCHPEEECFITESGKCEAKGE